MFCGEATAWRFALGAPGTAKVAETALRMAGLPDAFPDPVELAVALGYRVLTGRVIGGAEMVLGDRIYCDSRVGPERRTLVAHALAHCLVRDAGVIHTEADVWLLTGYLLVPAGGSRIPTGLLGKIAPSIPQWVFAARDSERAA